MDAVVISSQLLLVPVLIESRVKRLVLLPPLKFVLGWSGAQRWLSDSGATIRLVGQTHVVILAHVVVVVMVLLVRQFFDVAVAGHILS